MSVLPLFFGFLIGAVIGTIATAAKGEELREEAVTWFTNIKAWFDDRKDKRPAAQEQAGNWFENIQSWLDRRKAKEETALENVEQPAQRGAEGKTKPAWWSPLAALEMAKIEVLAIFSAIWTIGLLWVIFFLPAWEDRPHVQYILGSLVGAAAAPWIWLHFSRDLELSTADGGRFERYRFMTYTLGATLLIAVLMPYLGKLLPRANKIEGFGVALNLTGPRTDRNDRGVAIVQTGQQGGSSTFGATTSRLAAATTLAHHVTAGQHERISGIGGPEPKSGKDRKTLKNVKPDLDGFDSLSVRDRDRVYIAYFYHERNAQLGQPISNTSFSNLEDYVAEATDSIGPSSDDIFLADLADLSECISLYAENVRDFRLFLVKSEPFLKWLLVNYASQWREKNGLSSDSRLVPTVAVQPSKTGSSATSSPPPVSVKLREQVGPLAGEIAAALVASGVVAAAGDVCSTGNFADKEIPVAGIGTTPYPAYLIAHYLAAIDSVESGVLVLRDWLFHQRKQIANRTLPNGPEQQWYAIRAMLASSQIPYRFGSGLPTHRALVQFHKETTDRFAKLLGVNDSRSWQALCKRLDKTGLHTQIGRYLAWTYADERNYLFELLQPEDFGASKDPGLAITNVSPSTYLDEAEAILESSSCFAGVPRFTKDSRSLIGLFSLNAAQLRYAKRVSTEGEERAALTRKIRSDLDRARQLQADLSSTEVLDLQQQGSEFDVQRGRLIRLRTALDNESERD